MHMCMQGTLFALNRYLHYSRPSSKRLIWLKKARDDVTVGVSACKAALAYEAKALAKPLLL